MAWPCPAPDLPGEATLYTDSFSTPDGRAQLSAAPYLPPGEAPDAAYPCFSSPAAAGPTTTPAA